MNATASSLTTLATHGLQTYDNLSVNLDAAADEVGPECTEVAEADETIPSVPMFDDGFLIVLDGKKTTYDLEGTTLLAESQQWRFRAYAKNSFGTSSVASNIANVSTAANPDTGKPTDVRVAPTVTQTGEGTDVLADHSSSYGGMNIYWNWPVVDGEADPNVGGFQWQWRIRENDATSWPLWPTDETNLFTKANPENPETEPNRQAQDTARYLQ